MKPGYKQTEVGLIPEEWEVRSLRDLKPFVTSGSRGWAAFYSDRGSLFVRITNMSRDSIYLNLENSKFVNIPTESSEGIRTQLQEHDILISITADIGIVGYVDFLVPTPAYINQHIALVRFDQAKTCGKFVSYFLASERPQRFFRALTDTGAKAGMSLLTVQKLEVAFPSLPEQRAIAEALSDADDLLVALDRLIAKKRDLKKAAVQQLLTGQIRLPGYHDEWEAVRMSDLLAGPIQNGVFTEPLRKGRGCKLINVSDLYSKIPINEQSLEMFDADAAEIARFATAYGDVFFTRSSLTPDGIAHCNIYEALEKETTVFDCHIIRVRPNLKRVNPFFLFRYCTAYDARKYLIANAKTTTMTTIDQAVIANMPIKIPSLAEQTAIADALSDMDAELTILAQRREKIHAIKQGMMQELLTGKTRLIRPELIHA